MARPDDINTHYLEDLTAHEGRVALPASIIMDAKANSTNAAALRDNQNCDVIELDALHHATVLLPQPLNSNTTLCARCVTPHIRSAMEDSLQGYLFYWLLLSLRPPGPSHCHRSAPSGKRNIATLIYVATVRILLEDDCSGSLYCLHTILHCYICHSDNSKPLPVVLPAKAVATLVPCSQTSLDKAWPPSSHSLGLPRCSPPRHS